MTGIPVGAGEKGTKSVASGLDSRHPAKMILQGFRHGAVGGLQQDNRNASKDFITTGEDPVIPDGAEAVFGHRFRRQGRPPSAQPIGYHVIADPGNYLVCIDKTVPFRSGTQASSITIFPRHTAPSLIKFSILPAIS